MFDFSQIKTLVKKTQTHIELLPRHFSHGDLHNGNWSYHKLHNEDVISLIDMETSGLYRFGWDIGRMYTYLAGYPQDQEGLLEAITESLLSENEHIYFWRTVLIRSIRNIWGILNNRTVYGLSDQQKEERIKDLKQNVITASDFLEKV
jgi:thiamine kinase-like enzyme